MKLETPAEDELAERLRTIERRLDAIDAARNAGNTTIDQPGVLRVRTDDGDTVFVVGQVADGTMVMRCLRDDGTQAVGTSGALGGPQYVAMWDRGGNIIVADDTVSGEGLAWPNIPAQFVSNNTLSYNAITSAAFAGGEVATCYSIRQQPRLRVVVIVQTSDGSTAGEVQLWDATNSAQLGSVQVVPAGAYAIYVLGPVNVEANCGLHAAMNIQVRARRTAGAGSLRCAVAEARGLGS